MSSLAQMRQSLSSKKTSTRPLRSCPGLQRSFSSQKKSPFVFLRTRGYYTSSPRSHSVKEFVTCPPQPSAPGLASPRFHARFRAQRLFFFAFTFCYFF